MSEHRGPASDYQFAFLFDGEGVDDFAYVVLV